MKSDIKFIPKFLLLVASASAIFLSACSKNEFKIKGEIRGAEEQPIVLQKSDFNGRWLTLDSTRTNKKGTFSFSFPASSYPDIYRLSMNHQYIYFPVDSTETISVTSTYDKFGSQFNLSGSSNAERLAQFEKDLQAANTLNPDSIIEFKRRVYSTYMKDYPGSIVGFYILTKTINGQQLYDPAEASDRKYFGAVATGFKNIRPNDPRTTLLEQTAIQALKVKNNKVGNYKTVEAEEIRIIDLDLQNETGQNVKLSDIAGKGKPVVVIFSLLNHPDSPELNIRLANIYQKHKGMVEFYNVSLDSDQYTWREAAKNLPWITVYSPGGPTSRDAIIYNVHQLPTFYLYNAEGELVSRPLNLEELNNSL